MLLSVSFAVDEASFFVALDAPTYALSSEPSCPLALRACCAVLLSIGARLRRRAVPAKAYYDEAIRCGALSRAQGEFRSVWEANGRSDGLRSCTSLSMAHEAPSHLLASALLLQATSVPAAGGAVVDANSGALLASTAACILSLDRGASTRVRLSANILHYVLSSSATGVGWPASKPPIGASPADTFHRRFVRARLVPTYCCRAFAGSDAIGRYVEIQAFVVSQLVRNFSDIGLEHAVSAMRAVSSVLCQCVTKRHCKQDAFFALIDECLELCKSGVYADPSTNPVNLGIKAIFCHKARLTIQVRPDQPQPPSGRCFRLYDAMRCIIGHRIRGFCDFSG